MLDIALRELPQYYRFLWQSYRHASHLNCQGETLSSECGVQQGDPLGPMLYSLVTLDMVKQLKSRLKAAYLDDITLAGTLEDVIADITHVVQRGTELGLELNFYQVRSICFWWKYRRTNQHGKPVVTEVARHDHLG